jgi:hypothetical protein
MLGGLMDRYSRRLAAGSTLVISLDPAGVTPAAAPGRRRQLPRSTLASTVTQAAARRWGRC